MARKTTSCSGHDAAADGPRLQAESSRPRRDDRKPVAVAVSVRRQTPEEERQMEAVIDLFLAETVRQHFERQSQS